MTAELGSYKGKATLRLKANNATGYPFVGFGINKAKVILEHIEAIKQFVITQEHGQLNNDAPITPPPMEKPGELKFA